MVIVYHLFDFQLKRLYHSSGDRALGQVAGAVADDSDVGSQVSGESNDLLFDEEYVPLPGAVAGGLDGDVVIPALAIPLAAVPQPLPDQPVVAHPVHVPAPPAAPPAHPPAPPPPPDPPGGYKLKIHKVTERDRRIQERESVFFATSGIAGPLSLACHPNLAKRFAASNEPTTVCRTLFEPFCLGCYRCLLQNRERERAT